MYKFWHIFIKLEAQWAEPVSLIFHSALRKLNTEPSNQVSVHMAKQFQRKRFSLEIDQSETRIVCGGVAMFAIRSGRNEHSS